MRIKGISQEAPFNSIMADAIKRAGVKVKKPKRASWPRLKRNQPKMSYLEGGASNLHFVVSA